jgi:hypothetical protein
MPFIPSSTLILTHSLTGLIASYVLITNPSLLLSNTFTPVWMLGESMHIREVSSKWTSQASEPVATLGLLLAMASLTQAFFASGLAGVDVNAKGKQKQSHTELGEKVYRLRYAQTQWMGLAGLRVLLMGLLVGYTYVFEGMREGYMSSFQLSKISGISLLTNRAVFTASMTDMLFWGYLWTNVREEGRELAISVSRLREQNEEDELLNS